MSLSHEDEMIPRAHGETALHNAVLNGMISIAEWVEENKDAVYAQNESGMTPLHIAIQEGKKEMVEILLRNATKPGYVNCGDKYGWTALHDAAKKGRIDIMKLLLQKKPDTGAKTKNSGATALHIAADMGHANIVRLLLEANADKDVRSHDGRTALHWTLEAMGLGTSHEVSDSEGDRDMEMGEGKDKEDNFNGVIRKLMPEERDEREEQEKRSLELEKVAYREDNREKWEGVLGYMRRPLARNMGRPFIKQETSDELHLIWLAMKEQRHIELRNKLLNIPELRFELYMNRGLRDEILRNSELRDELLRNSELRDEILRNNEPRDELSRRRHSTNPDFSVESASPSRSRGVLQIAVILKKTSLVRYLLANNLLEKDSRIESLNFARIITNERVKNEIMEMLEGQPFMYVEQEPDPLGSGGGDTSEVEATKVDFYIGEERDPVILTQQRRKVNNLMEPGLTISKDLWSIVSSETDKKSDFTWIHLPCNQVSPDSAVARNW